MLTENSSQCRQSETRARSDVWQKGCNELCSVLGRIGKLEMREGNCVIFGNDKESEEKIALEFSMFDDDLDRIRRCLSGQGEKITSDDERRNVERLLYKTWQSLSALSSKMDGDQKEKYRNWVKIHADEIIKILEDNFVGDHFE